MSTTDELSRPVTTDDLVACDVDAHEMAPSHLWGDIFGVAANEIATILEPLMKGAGDNSMYNPSVMTDNAVIDPFTVWQSRGIKAPGAFDLSRRPEVLDTMLVTRQMVFPSFAVYALVIQFPRSMWRHAMDLGGRNEEELSALGRAGLDEHNEWAVRTAALDHDRLRPVVYLPPASSVDALVEYAKGYIDRGIRAVHLAVNEPPAGCSPAHPDLDPFWALLAERSVALLTHFGADQGFMTSFGWSNAPAFLTRTEGDATEVGLHNSHFFATLHYAYSNFLASMVLGGVFERHPTLRFGVIEAGASWFGPFAEQLDHLATTAFTQQVQPYLSMRPSEYLSRNVRVTPFCGFEAVDEMFRRFPELSDCYCFSTDYPHIEGGLDSKQKMVELLTPLGTEVMEKFFLTNGQLLLPD